VRYAWAPFDSPLNWTHNLVLNLRVGLAKVHLAVELGEHGLRCVFDRSILSPLAIAYSFQVHDLEGAVSLADACRRFRSEVPETLCRLLVIDPPDEVWRERLSRHEKARSWPWSDPGFQSAEQSFFLALAPTEGVGASGRVGTLAELFEAGVSLLS